MIGDEHLQQKRSEYEKPSHDMAIEARDQLRNFPHRGNVGGDVENIGDEQQQHDALEHDARERGLDVRGKSFSGNPPDEPAHGLDHRHQWKGERHRPQHVEAELRARLGVGGYAAWIVVGNTGNKSWPQPRQGVLFQANPKDPKGALMPRCIDFILRTAHSFSGDGSSRNGHCRQIQDLRDNLRGYQKFSRERRGGLLTRAACAGPIKRQRLKSGRFAIVIAQVARVAADLFPFLLRHNTRNRALRAWGGPAR